MATSYTDIVIIVIRPSLQAQAELAARAADPASGAGTFVPGNALCNLGDAAQTPSAYWCRWNMQPAQHAAFAQTIGGPLNVLKLGASVPAGRDRYLFDATEGQWTPEAVMAALGLDYIRATY